MPRLSIQQNNFTTGEISPRLYGRTDIDRYGSSARQMVNAHPVVHGGAKRRAGTRYYKPTKLSGTRSRLIPFVYSRDTAYMLEVGDNYVRVHGAGGADIGVEVGSPYTAAQIDAIDYAHGADTMFLFHEAVTPQKLLRLAPTTWTLGSASFLSLPFDDVGTSPGATLYPERTGPVGGTILLTAGTPGVGHDNSTSTWTGGQALIGCVAHGFATGDVVRIAGADPEGYDTGGSAITVTGPDNFQFSLPLNPGKTTVLYGVSNRIDPVGIFSGADIGKVIKINGGTVQITGLVSSASVQGIVRQEMTTNVPSPPDGWSMHVPVWNGTAGYPRCGTLFEQRLVCAGSPAYPQTIWGSATAGYLDFLQGTADDDPYSFTIASDEVNPISYLAALRNLVVHTYGGEFSVQGGIEKPITATNVRVRAESKSGSKGVRPVTVGKESVFVQRSGRKVRALGYSPMDESYRAPDILMFSEHLTQDYGISGLAYQQEPNGIMWAWRDDGAFLSCTIDRDQSVLGWAPHYTQGVVESIATIPNGSRDETWMIVRRTVNGATVRYLEIMDDAYQPLLPGAAPTGFPPFDSAVTYGCTVDCGKSFDSGGGQTTFAVPHLIGCTVDIVADGYVMPQQVVPVSGNVTISRPSYRTLIGLHFDSKVGLLSPEVGTGTGTAQGNSMRTSEITMRFLNTIGARVLDGDGQEQEVPFQRFGGFVFGQPPEPFTGNVRIETLGWERGRSEFTVVQDQPLPMHLLAVVRKFQVND